MRKDVRMVNMNVRMIVFQIQKKFYIKRPLGSGKQTKRSKATSPTHQNTKHSRDSGPLKDQKNGNDTRKRHFNS